MTGDRLRPSPSLTLSPTDTLSILCPPPLLLLSHGPRSSQGEALSPHLRFIRLSQLTRYPYRIRLLFWATVGQFTPLCFLMLPERLMLRNKCRKDLAHEPVREQEVQQPVQGNHRSRLVRPLPYSVSRARFTNSGSLSSLTKEVMVDDRLVTMQVRILSSPTAWTPWDGRV